RSVELALRERRRVAGCEQEAVAVAQRHLQLLRELAHHLRARPRATGLDEAEMPRRDACLKGELELAQPPTMPPITKQRPHGGRRRHDVHPAIVVQARATPHYLTGNRHRTTHEALSVCNRSERSQ